MKLLLTSAGLINSKLEEEFTSLTGKTISETTITYINTATLKLNDNQWAKDELENFKDRGWKEFYLINDIDIVDAMGKIQKSDVIYVQGGDNIYLLKEVYRSGIDRFIKHHILNNKLYVGVSAGSMLLMPDTLLIALHNLYKENLDESSDYTALNIIPYYVVPHLNSKYFPSNTVENVEKYLSNNKNTIYVYDDNTALKVDGDIIELVGDKTGFKIN